VLLRAVPEVLEEVPECSFVFVGRDVMEPGSPSSSQALRREADALGIGHAIEFTGQLDRAGVETEIERATVCAFPSLWESFGNVVAEASAVGRPVVATPIPPFQDLVQEGVTGRLVPREDTSEWAKALIDLLQDRERARKMGEAGARHVAGISDPAHVAALTLSAYEHARSRWQGRERAGHSRLFAR
jgi:mannosyltransferase